VRLDDDGEEAAFRAEAADWLRARLDGPFAGIRHDAPSKPSIAERLAWEAELGRGGWHAIGWPRAFGGRDASLAQQVIFAEEYARAGALPRIGHVGYEFVAPTILAFGSEAQRQRFLPDLAAGTAMWAQLFSEPNAGSDLFALQTHAELRGDRWVINGGKIWSSYAQYSGWGALLCRTDKGSRGGKGLSMLLVPLRQKGVEIRPIRQMTGDDSFNSVFFDDAECAADDILGAPGDGAKIAISLLQVERGISMLAQQMALVREYDRVVAAARSRGSIGDPLIRDRLTRAHVDLALMRATAVRVLGVTGDASAARASLTYKLNYAACQQRIGELAMDVLGNDGLSLGLPGARASGMIGDFLLSRAASIYGGTDQIQRTVIAERGLGLPREAA
jgi:alkylation response protein AidB-like acyl-CoA dehydrogenase